MEIIVIEKGRETIGWHNKKDLSQEEDKIGFKMKVGLIN